MKTPNRTKKFMYLLSWGIWSAVCALMVRLIYLELNVGGVLFQDGWERCVATAAIWLLGSIVLWSF